MRLDQYMKISSPDEDISKFRSLNIGIVKEDVDYDSIIYRLSEKYDYIQESLDLVDNINKVFRSVCRGVHKFKYKLCLDENIHLSEVNINSSSRKKMQFKQHQA